MASDIVAEGSGFGNAAGTVVDSCGEIILETVAVIVSVRPGRSDGVSTSVGSLFLVIFTIVLELVRCDVPEISPSGGSCTVRVIVLVIIVV